MATESFFISGGTSGVTSIFGRTGAVLAQSGDYTFSQLSSLPTTLAGYSISDGVSTSSTYSNPSWLTSLAWSKLTGTPTTLGGYGITDAINVSAEGVANGVATLDSGGKIPLAQLPAQATTPKGTWNANTNTPTLTNGSGSNGDFYFTSVAGSTNFGAGSISFNVGDVVLYNGTIWSKIPTGGLQQNSDWSSGSGVSQILNKPTTFTTLAVNMSTAKLLGRWSAGSGIPQEVTISTGLSLDGSGNLTSTGGSIDTLTGATLNTISYGASITFNGNNGTLQQVTLTGNTALTISNLKVGIPYTFLIIQDVTGNRQVTWPTVKVAYHGVGVPPISTIGGAIDKYTLTYTGTTILLDYGLRYD